MGYPSHPYRRAAALGRAASLALVIGLPLAACELGLHEIEQSRTDRCEPWRAGCAAVIDYAASGPINPPRADIDREDIVAAAAAAPYRPCDTVALVCQGRVIGDVIRDQYLAVLLGDPTASASAPSNVTRSPNAGAPASVVPPEPAEPAARGRIVRTQGTRAGEVSPVPPAPSR